MKAFKALAVTCILALAVSAGTVHAEETATAGTASVDFMSNYVWRGQKLSNSWVIQPAVGITYGPVSAGIWGNYDSDRYEASGSESGHGEFTEVDFTLSYSRTIGSFSVGGGYIFYAFDGANDTQEVYLTGTYNGLLSPTLALYYDYDEGNGLFAIAGVSHTFELPKEMALKLGATASYNFENRIMGFDEDGKEFNNFYNAELSTALTVPITKHLSLTPKVAYSFALSNDAKDALEAISDDGDENVLYGGLNLTLSF